MTLLFSCGPATKKNLEVLGLRARSRGPLPVINVTVEVVPDCYG